MLGWEIVAKSAILEIENFKNISIIRIVAIAIALQKAQAIAHPNIFLDYVFLPIDRIILLLQLKFSELKSKKLATILLIEILVKSYNFISRGRKGFDRLVKTDS